MNNNIIKASLCGLWGLVLGLCLWGTTACQSSGQGQDEGQSLTPLHLELGEEVESLPDSLWRYLALPRAAVYATPDSGTTAVACLPYGTLLALAEQRGDWTQVHVYLDELQIDNPATYKLWLATEAIAGLEELSLTPSLIQSQEARGDAAEAEEQAYEVQLIDEATYRRASQHRLPRQQGEPWTQFPLEISRPSGTTYITAEEGAELEGQLGYLRELNLYYLRGCGNSRCYWELYPQHEDIELNYWVSDVPLCSPDKQWLYDEDWSEANSLGAILIAEGEAKQAVYRHFPCWRGCAVEGSTEGLAFMDAEGWIYLRVCPNVRTGLVPDEALPQCYLRLRLKASITTPTNN